MERQYPQLNLRGRGHSDTYFDLSSDLADLIRGRHDFKGMDHALKVARLYGLIKCYQFVMDLGMFEHTGDWDWRISVLCEHRDFPGEDPSEDCEWFTDDIALLYDVEPGDYTSHFDRWTELTITRYHSDGETSTVLVPIDRILHITIEEA